MPASEAARSPKQRRGGVRAPPTPASGSGPGPPRSLQRARSVEHREPDASKDDPIHAKERSARVCTAAVCAVHASGGRGLLDGFPRAEVAVASRCELLRVGGPARVADYALRWVAEARSATTHCLQCVRHRAAGLRARIALRIRRHLTGAHGSARRRVECPSQGVASGRDARSELAMRWQRAAQGFKVTTDFSDEAPCSTRGAPRS
jgi:hypothetical protein